MNAPIPVSDALKLLSMALAQTEGYADDLGCCGGCVLARATMRPLLGWLDVQVRYKYDPEHDFVDQYALTYPPLAALMAHYDATRPDWRTR